MGWTGGYVLLALLLAPYLRKFGKFTVPKVKDARSSAGWALVFIAILYTTAPAVGSMARLNLMNTIQVGEVGSAEGNLAYADRPQWFKNWKRPVCCSSRTRTATAVSSTITTPIRRSPSCPTGS
jgi:Na+(H+)/acetate symporter ActP